MWHNIYMPRKLRIDLGDYVYHVINRASGRMKIFHNDADYLDFEYLLKEVKDNFDMRILAYVVMPNHWHMLLYPKNDGDLRKALQWLGTSHALRHHSRKGTTGEGHLYQGRYKSFLVEDDNHLLTVLKYIERNPVRSKLCTRAEEWRWGSAHRRNASANEQVLLAEPPVVLPLNYSAWVNEPESSEMLDDVRRSVRKSVNFGNVVINKITP